MSEVIKKIYKEVYITVYKTNPDLVSAYSSYDEAMKYFKSEQQRMFVVSLPIDEVEVIEKATETYGNKKEDSV